MGLDLDVENGVLKGEVTIGCTSGGTAQCAEAIKNMKALNNRADIDIDIRQVAANDSYDIALKFDKNLPSGGRYTDRYSKLFKSWRWNRTITLNPSSARPNAALHEFGHSIGLGHQGNSTNSIMSYSASRQPRLRDVEAERLRRAY